LDNLNDAVYRVQLADARINFTSEVGRKKLNLTGIKEAIGGGLLTGRALFQGPVQFYPNCSFVISMNHFFPLEESGSAVARRFGDTIVQFSKNHEEQIDNLAQIIIEHELPAVLRWAMDGVELFMECGLESLLSNELFGKWITSVDPVSLFIDEQIEFSYRIGISGVKRGDLWKRFKDFCSDSGYYLVRKGDFFEQISHVKGMDKVVKMKGEATYVNAKWRLFA
jgi:phage/plasmid-associated DNA primase